MVAYHPLPGSRRELLPHSRLAGPVDVAELASLTIRVRPGRAAPMDLVKLAYDLAQQPLSERKYLTRAELEQQHGASKNDLDRVEHYVQQHNLMVTYRSAVERSIVVRGKLGDLLNAFHADVQMFHSARGTYRGRTGEIGVPNDLQDIVTGVFGYDTRPKHRSPSRRKRWMASGPGGSNGVAATEFAKRYGFPTTHNGGKALDGSGQTIAILELGGGFRQSDLQAYFHEIGVPSPQVISVAVDRAGNQPTTSDSADGEVMLDIEVAGAVAPGAKIAVYFAPNTGDKGFLDALSAMVHDAQRDPSVISISWGSPEATTDQQGLDAYHQVFAAAAVLGITICVAAGDHGTADMDAASWDGQIHVDHPACDDLVLSCGGTQVENGTDVVWNDGTSFNKATGEGGWAGGGGISTLFQVPSYQQGAQIPASLVSGKGGRGVPDIAMSATNYFVRVDSYEGASGGTSAVAPLMAALVVLLNQATDHKVGFLNPFLYANAAQGIVHGVTSGTNAIAGTVKGYDAGAGWNACTGLGTPDGAAILQALQAPATGQAKAVA